MGQIDEAALVLDVGGAASPFDRADWVIDLLPYAQRGLYGYEPDPGRERFSESTWAQRDICDRQAWPFADQMFAFAVCSHTLEDVRDPLWVCSELIRVARAGYIEVPSRLEEQSWGVHGPWVGWSHHHWFVDVDDDSKRIQFVFKTHVVHGRASDHFDADFHAALSAKQRVQELWWAGSFEYHERIFVDAEELDAYLAQFVAANQPRGRLAAPRQSFAQRLTRR